MSRGGQADLDATGNVNHPGDLLAQADAALAHVRRVVGVLGGRFEDVVKINVFHTGATVDAEDRAAAPHPQARPGGGSPRWSRWSRCRASPIRGWRSSSTPSRSTMPTGGAPREGFTLADLWPWPAGARFSHGVRCGEMMFVAAQSARDAGGAIQHREDIVAQAQMTIANIGRVLAVMGADLDDVVKLNTWFVGFGTDEDWRRAARVRSEAFQYPGPGATGVPARRPTRTEASSARRFWAMRGTNGKRLPRTLSWPKGHWDWPIRVTFQQGVKVGKFVFLGGQYACDVSGKAVSPGDAEAQARITMEFIRRILFEFGATLDDLVQTKCFYKSDGTPEALHANLAVRSASFSDPAQAQTSVALATMGLEGLMLEIEGIAVLGSGP